MYLQRIKEIYSGLKEHQEEVLLKIAEKNLLVVHDTGLGKTLPAIIASILFLQDNPDKSIVVVSPAGLVGNFKKESDKHGLGIQLDKYKFFSFRSFKDIDCTDCFLIIDEVHNLRTIGTKSYSYAYKSAKQASKVLLLTATPMVNYLSDFKSLINLVHQNDNKSKCLSTKPKHGTPRYQEDLDSIKTLLTGYTAYKSNKNTEGYPEVTIHEHNLPCTKEYYIKYLHALSTDVFGSSPESFYHGYRRIVNNIGLSEYYSKKLDILASLINNQQSLIFTNWLQFGTSIIIKELIKNSISYKVIDGSVNVSDRQFIVSQYNKSFFKVLIITKAGYEGLDLKGTRNIIILDPVWNLSGINQIMGRGIRYLSHSELPESERKVSVHKLVLTSPENPKEIQEETGYVPAYNRTGDEILYTIIAEKTAVTEDILVMLGCI
jgi:SNF2 family DNA or RNA helicase